MVNVKDVRFSKEELDSYTKATNSCVKLEKKTRVLFLLPSHLADLNVGVREALDSLLLKYDYLYKAIIIGYNKIKIKSRYGSICYGRSKIALQIEADFYLFNPVVGCKLKGVVCKQNSNLLGCLVYKAFNVYIPLEEDEYTTGWDFTIGQDVIFTVIKLDLSSGPLPYIKGQLEDSEIKGKHASSSGSQVGTDSGFDNGTEDDLDSETEESNYEPTSSMVNSLSEAGKSNKRNKSTEDDEKDVGKALFLRNDEEIMKSILTPLEAKSAASDSEPFDGVMEELSFESPAKTKRKENLATVNDAEPKLCENSEMTEYKPQQSGETVEKTPKKKSRGSSGKRDSLISQLLTSVEQSFEGKSEGTTATPPKKVKKQRDSTGSSVKTSKQHSSGRKSITGVSSPISGASKKTGDKMVPLSEEPSHLGSAVKETIIETSIDSVVIGKVNKKSSPMKKASREEVKSNDNVPAPSSSDEGSLHAEQSIATKEKTGGQSDYEDSTEVPEGGSGNMSSTKESETESIIEKLLDMNKKLLGVGQSSKKKSRKSTSGTDSPLSTEVDRVKLSSTELPRDTSDTGEVGTPSRLGNLSKIHEKPTSSKKERHKKSIDGILSPSMGKTKSKGDKHSGKLKKKASLGGIESQMLGSPMEGDGKKKSEHENILDELLSINKKLLGVVDGDPSTGKVSSKDKRKRESAEGHSSPPLKMVKLKESEN